MKSYRIRDSIPEQTKLRHFYHRQATKLTKYIMFCGHETNCCVADVYWTVHHCDN